MSTLKWFLVPSADFGKFPLVSGCLPVLAHFGLKVCELATVAPDKSCTVQGRFIPQ